MIVAPGIVCGAAARETTRAKLDADILLWDPIALRADLMALPLGLTHDFYAGQLANMEGDTALSIRLLKGAFRSFRRTDRKLASSSLEILVDDYRRQSDYSKEYEADSLLLREFRNELALAGDVAGIHSDLLRVEPLRGLPKQTVTWNGFASLPTQRNVLGTLDAALTVNGVTAPWMLDTGANYSLISESLASRLHLIIRQSNATIRGSTGVEVPIRWAVIERLQLGDAVLCNVPVMVLSDASLHIKTKSAEHQIVAALGAPEFQALGRVTFFTDGRLVAGEKGTPGGSSTKLYMNGWQPVLAGMVKGQSLLFDLDTGASFTSLNCTYYNRFSSELRPLIVGKQSYSGAGGRAEVEVVKADLAIAVGGRTVTLKSVPVSIGNQGQSACPAGNGRIGQDLLRTADSFTIDFRRMSFSLNGFTR